MLVYQRVDDSFPFNMVPFFGGGVPFVHFEGARPTEGSPDSLFKFSPANERLET